MSKVLKQMAPKTQDLSTFPAPGNRYKLNHCIDSGCYGKVYLAIDTQASQKQVAIKIQKINDDSTRFIEQEYKVLRDLTTNHSNLPDFYGIYHQDRKIWLVMELCGGGTVLDFVQGLIAKNRRITEEHIAHILKEAVKALVYLHENRIIHRDIKSKNILLTKNGEIKLCDFGFSCCLQDSLGKTNDCLGSPNWMAPEIINSLRTNPAAYDNRVDVWSLGITAIEIADGQPPYHQMHPTRILFQIVTNPPPDLIKIANWSQNFTDFISECLVKNPEHRPYMLEVAEHPFLEQVPENNYHLSLEIKAIINDLDQMKKPENRVEIAIQDQFMKVGDGDFEPMFVEDLASLNKITETTIMNELEARMKLDEFQTFIGDILLTLNPNVTKPIFNEDYHRKYEMKSRSENAPHIYSVADSAYQNAVHHHQPQRILLLGESGSGKTANYHHLVDHLIHMGRNENINIDRLKGAIDLIHALTHASTPINNNSTRCLIKTEMKFNATGKITGAIYRVYQLEKWRISSNDVMQGNFHFLYMVRDGLIKTRKTDEFLLKLNHNYRYLRINDKYNRNIDGDVENNAKKFKKIMKILHDFAFDQQQIDTILSVIVAILIIGEVRFQDIDDDDNAIIANHDEIEKVCELLKIDTRKLNWALTNYCVIEHGAAVRKRKTLQEAQSARDVLANTLYIRLVDYIVGSINQKLAVGRSLFGEKYSVQIYDYFGFECFKTNDLSQLLINVFNEELHYHYLQRIFAWETLDVSDEQIDYENVQFYDNKQILDLLLDQSIGVLSFIDEASKYGHGGSHVIDFIEQQEKRHVSVEGVEEFSVAHFTGKITYNIKDMPEKNRDFLPPEIIETMRLSDDPIVRLFFTNKLNRTGNLLMPDSAHEPTTRRYNYTGNTKSKRLEFSQIRKMRTSISVFKSISLEVLKELSVGSGSGGMHFIKSVRTSLKNRPDDFNYELIRQQIRALAIVETAKARQTGYPYRVSFLEFLRRYQFLAFDFNETVEITRDNCRLLLIRLKMEDWAIGKSRVFLKYHNEEYLARLYESHVRKIVKIQSILRGFLAKCRVARQTKTQKTKTVPQIETKSHNALSEDEAASIIQRAYRESTIKKTYPDFAKDYKILDDDTCNFLRPFVMKWRKKSVFQVLLQYRAVKLQEMFNFSQQVHFYNLAVFHDSLQINSAINLRNIDRRAQPNLWLGETKSAILKVPFRLDEIPFYNVSAMCSNAFITNDGNAERHDDWDTPYRWRELITPESRHRVDSLKRKDAKLTELPYNRDPNVPIRQLEATTEDEDGDDEDELITKQTQSKLIKNQKNQQKQFKRTLTKQKTIDESHVNSNAKLANKDFNYIKTPIVNKPKHIDPVSELKNISRRSSLSDEDDPPFNFKAMLRKTNYQKEPTRSSVIEDDFNKIALKKTAPQEIKDLGKKISMELSPGVRIEGIEVDL